MKHQVTLTITSLISILLVSLHISEDIVRGFEPGGLKNISPILIMATWLYATLVLGGRRSGLILVLLGSLLGMLISVAHMRGVGLVGGRMVGSDGVLFFVWTVMALGATATVSAVLSAQALWNLRRGAREAGASR